MRPNGLTSGLNERARTSARAFVVKKRRRLWREVHGVPAGPELSQHFLEVRDSEDKKPLVGIIDSWAAIVPMLTTSPALIINMP